MMRLPRLLFLAGALSLTANSAARAGLSIVESNLGSDTPAVIVNGGFGEDVVVFSDRVHQHNGARFSDAFGAGTLLPVGVGAEAQETVSMNLPLPSYLVGGDYVRFANSARDNVGYSAVVSAGSPKDWYLLIDNRADGPNGNGDGSFFNDPNLGGTLQWVLDDGWQRVNTGLSPTSAFGPLGDYTGVDESPADGSALGVGPGVSVNNFYAVYVRKNLTSVTLGNLAHAGGVSMYSLVAVPEPASLLVLACGAIGLAGGRRKSLR